MGSDQVTLRAEGTRFSAWLSVPAFERAVIISTIGVLVAFAAVTPWHEVARKDFLLLPFWVGVIGIVELLHVQVWRSIQVSIGVPLLMAVAFHYPPSIAGAVAFLGSSDPREIRREVSMSRALFNRSQVALSVLLASFTFHALGGQDSSWVGALRGAPAAVLVDFVANTTLVSALIALSYRIPLREVRRRLRIGNAQEFLISYMGLGLLGVLLARLYHEVDWWAVAGFVLPLLLARQMFFRTRALEEATKELQDREVVLRALSNRMAEERQDERLQIAGYLHDDLAQVLYRMALHLDVVEAHLRERDPNAVEAEVERLRKTRNRAQELVRALIKDLHRSPLGRAGLVHALESFCQDVQEDTQVRIRRRLQEVEMPPPLQLLCYHVAREAVMNSVKHAEATEIEVSLEPVADGARLIVRDDGRGFDVDAGEPEGHFGLTMMRERALVAGGTFRIDSGEGRGTRVTAEFPTALLGATPPPLQESDAEPAPDAQP